MTAITRQTMRRLGVIGLLAVGTLLSAGRLAPDSLAQTTPDRSEVVIVLDSSASILEDVANRNRFAAALDRIADRVDATSADLVGGDTAVSIVQFATSAADYPGCVDLKLLNSPKTVARFADCLRNVAKAYRKGPDPALTRKIGLDTNYVAAMERAAGHLPLDAVRPALVLFTDGKHDVNGVPVSQVQPARQRLFGDRSPFALLPVGMGLRPAERDALEKGLVNLRIIRDMPACVSGARFDWPQVVFNSPDDAGNAVAVALQNVSCTFTVALPAPTPTHAPTPTPAPTPSAVGRVRLTPGDGWIEVAWTPPAETPTPVVSYRIRCRSGEGEWTELEQDASLNASASVEGLVNGAAYTCEVAAADARSASSWTAAPGTATPMGRPAVPGKPTVEAVDGALRIQVSTDAASLVSRFRYECSSDGGATWPASIDASASGATTAEIGSLVNGLEYVCRAVAVNAAGMSDPSEPSEAVRLCGSFVDCNPVVAPALGVVGLLLLGLIVALLFALYRGRTQAYVVAVVDVVHTVNLGHGSRLGIRLVRTRPGGPVIEIVADSGEGADFRIRHRRGDRFDVTDRRVRHVAMSGQPIVAIDSAGVPHEVILRRFHTATAARFPGRR